MNGNKKAKLINSICFALLFRMLSHLVGNVLQTSFVFVDTVRMCDLLWHRNADDAALALCLFSVRK